MQFLEIVGRLKEFLCRDYSAYFIPNKKEAFIKIVNTIEAHFILLSEDKELPEIDNQMSIDIKDCLNELRYFYFQHPITQEYASFSIDFSILVFNWNDNTVKNEEICAWCPVVERFYKNHLTSLDLFNLLKMLNEQLQKYQVFALPSVELSKQYLKAFDDKECASKG